MRTLLFLSFVLVAAFGADIEALAAGATSQATKGPASAVNHNSSRSNFSRLAGKMDCDKCSSCTGKCVKNGNTCFCYTELKPMKTGHSPSNPQGGSGEGVISR